MADIKAKIGADVKDFQLKMKGVENRMKQVAKRAQDIGKSMLKLTVAFAGLATGAVLAFDKQIQAENKLKAALKTTGQASKETFKDLKKFASGLQDITTIGDESTLQMLQVAISMGLSAEQAKRASKNAIAMSKAMGINEQSAIRYTAALEEGDATMLTRYLPSLRSIEDQSERAAAAQKLLAGMFDTATAEAKEGLGPFKQMVNTMGDMLETFGALIAQAIKPFIEFLKEMSEKLNALNDTTKKWILIIGGVIAVVGPLLILLGTMATTVLPAIIAGFALMTGPIGLVVLAVGLLIAGFIAFNTVAKKTKTAQQQVNKVFQEARKSVAAEIVQLKALADIARDDTRSRKEREGAIKTLNEKYPQYLKNLNLENIGTRKVVDSINATIQSLINKAKVRKAEAAIESLALQQIELEKEANEARARARGKIDNKWLLSQKQIEVTMKAAKLKFIELGGAMNENKEAMKRLISFTAQYATQQNVLGQSTATVTGNIEEETEAMRKQREEEERLAKEKADALKVAGEAQKIEADPQAFFDIQLTEKALIKRQQLLDEDEQRQLEQSERIRRANLTAAERTAEDWAINIEKVQEKFNQIAEVAEQIWGQITDIIGQSIENKMIALENTHARELEIIEESGLSEKAKAKAIEDLDEKTADKRKQLQRRQAKLDKANAIFSAIINIAAAITKNLANPILAAITAGLGAVQLGKIIAQPIPFAHGGIVTSPTVGLIGEAGPEAVIPLSKMDMFGGELRTKITAEDIELILTRRNKRLSFTS